MTGANATVQYSRNLRTMRPILLLAALLPACSYSPPPQTNTGSPQYRADLNTCSTTVPDAIDKRAAKTGLAWFANGVTRWGAIDDGVKACMEQHGWGHLRACTPAELAHANTTPGLVVTAAGVRCSDPNRVS